MPLRRSKDLGGTKYRMREKVFALGDDYWVETTQASTRSLPARTTR